MPTHRFPRLLGTATVAVAVAGSVVVLGGGAARAASAPTTTVSKPAGTSAVFCAQLRSSQTAMAQLNAQVKDRYVKVAAEWGKIERFAPADIKADVTAIRTAYEKASKQTGAAQTATLKAAATPAQKVTTYSTKNCTALQGGGQGQGGPGGPGGDGPNAAALQAFRDCMAKQGVTDFGFGGRRDRDGAPGQAPQTPPTTNAKTAAAFQKCQSLLPAGGLGGPGGGGGFGRGGGGLGSPELQACLQQKGITLPQPQGGQGQGGAQGQGGQGRGQGGGGGRLAQLDEKTRAALQACRDQLNAARTAPTTTVKKTTV